MTQIDPAQSALFENVRKPKAAQKPARSQEKGKSKRTEVSAPVFGIKSTPGYAPGLKDKDDSAVALAFEHLPFPKLGVERGFTTPTARQNANTLAKTVAESSGTLTDEGRAALMGFSGGGGLGESLTAFYTPTPLAAYVWALVSGVHDGRLKSALEPSCGVGAFLMTAPAGIRVTGVEFDTLTANIASLLNPYAHIHNLIFETFTTTSVDPFVDVVVGNPPFGDRGRLSGHRGLEGSREDRHEWFFLNSAISRVKPGGIVAMIVPEDLVREGAYTERRRKLLSRATVLGVIGVPTGAFAASNAGVMSVILVLRRHDQGVEAGLNLLSDKGSTETNDKGETILIPSEREAMLRILGAWVKPFVDGHTTFAQKGEEWVSIGLNVAVDTKVTHSRFGDPQLSGKIHLDQARLDHHLANLKVRLDTAVSRSALLSAVRAKHGQDHLRNGQYKHQPESEINGRLKALSCRDAARLMARDGRQTYLDDHKLGWTLGTPMLSNEELKREVTNLPADLHAGVVRLNHCLKHLAVLAAGMPESLDDARFEEFGTVTVAFVVTGGHPDRLAKDALSELFDDIVQQRVHMLDEADSWPLWSVPATSQADYHQPLSTGTHPYRPCSAAGARGAAGAGSAEVLSVLPHLSGHLTAGRSRHHPESETLARKLIRQGAPFNLESRTATDALGWAAPSLPAYGLTLGWYEAATLQLIGERTDFEYLDVNLAMHLIHDAQPGAAAWLLNEMDRAFGVTFPFATPKWALDTLHAMYRTTPASRNRTYRQRHGRQVGVRESERLIAKEGYSTTYSVQLEFGKRLLSDRTCDTVRARTAFQDRWPRVLEILDAANALLVGTDLKAAYDVVVPAYLLETILDHKRDENTFTGELADEMFQHFRNGVENFCVPLSSGKQTRRLYACLDGHAELAEELAKLLKGALAYP